MRVLQINAVYGYGSTGLIVKDLAEMIESNGGECYVAFQMGEKPEKSYKFSNRLDEKLHALYTRVFGKQGYASRLETKKFLKWVDKIKPDIVQLHNLHSNYINLPMLLKYLAEKDIATVVTLHDCWFFTGKCTHYISHNCDKFEKSCGNCPEKHYEFNSLFFDKTKKVVLDREKYFSAIKRLTIVGTSKWIAGECKKSRLKNCNITYIPNGIDGEIFKPTENKFKKGNGLDGKFLILGFADKWREERNREAVENIIASSGDDDRIIIVGCDKYDKARFSKYEKVIALGFIKDRYELADIYSSCDVFVNLTHADTLPTVNMESIASGTPVITYDSSGSPELVDGGSGFVVDEDDYNGIIEKIQEVKKGFVIDTDKYGKKFDKAENFINYLKVYKELTEKK